MYLNSGAFSSGKLGGCKMNQPTVSGIIDRLKSVLNGELTREEVSDWASYYMMEDDPTIDDEIV